MVLNLVPNSRGSAALGTILNAYRVRAGKSLVEVAESASISREYLRLIETGQRVPVRAVLGRIVGVLSLEPNIDVRWDYPDQYMVSLRNPSKNQVYKFKFVSRIKEARRPTRNKDVGHDKLTGKDYMDKPMIELQSHPDYSAHAYRIVIAIREMTTEELENLTIARGPH